MRVAYISDALYQRHDTGSHHPESAQRLVAIEQALLPLRERLVAVEPIEASRVLIGTIHTPSHIERIWEASLSASAIDTDTVCSHDSYLAAAKAVGAGIVALDGIKAGEYERTFCAVRPPGHHARPDQAMGFCLFNSVAVTARYAQKSGYAKVMVVDFDVHHGNGTQDAFYEDDTVFYFSSHQAFAYPGTGMENEVGRGKGTGYTSNHLLMPDSGDAEIEEIYREELPTAVAHFDPDIILVSAGYDIHQSDPLAQLDVSTEGVRNIVRYILDSAKVPFIFFLEGGYQVDALGENVSVTIEEMMK